MRIVRKTAVLAVAVPLLVLVACGDGGGLKVGSPVPIEGGLPATFPDDFPLYPDLDIVQTSPLGERYVVEAVSDDPVQDIVDFYDEELRNDPWEILDIDESAAPQTILFRLTAPGWPVDGRVQVSERDDERGKTVVGIAVPINIREDE